MKLEQCLHNATLGNMVALFADALLASYRRAIESVAAARGDIGAAALRLAAIWRAGGRLVYLGAGSSGLAAAADAAELPGTFGLDESRIAIILAGGATPVEQKRRVQARDPTGHRVHRAHDLRQRPRGQLAVVVERVLLVGADHLGIPADGIVFDLEHRQPGRHR